MKGFVGVTDKDWCALLSQQSGIDEMNFWKPSSVFPVFSNHDKVNYHHAKTE